METREKYRQMYIEGEQDSQEDLDKSLIALSGGAFAVTFSFVSNFIDGEPVLIGWLISSWLSWGLCIVASLFSYYLSTLAFRSAIEELDDGKDFEDVDPGGRFTTCLNIVNPVSLGLFVFGVISISVFVIYNV